MTETSPQTSASETRTRILMLMRHAKAGSAFTDHARPLAPRGKHDAEAMGQVLAERGVIADLVLCSSAKRTLETWEHVAKGGGRTLSFQESDGLYDASYRDIVGVLRHIPDAVDTAIVVGHFPGIPDAVDYLAEGTGPEEVRDAMSWGFPTASLVTLQVTGSWRDIDAGTVELVAFDTPS